MNGESKRAFIALSFALIACGSRSREESDGILQKTGITAPRPASSIELQRECSEDFAALDSNGDGRISAGEFLARQHGYPDAEGVFNWRDRNRDGFLDESEFCSEALASGATKACSESAPRFTE